MNSVKRKRDGTSPDGSSGQRKMSKGFPTDKNPQRKPSLNTNLVNSSADPRRQRANAPLQSPISTDGSAYQDAASTRTTPQPQLPAQKAVMTVVRDTNDDADALKKQLLESLVTLTSHITADAALRSSHDLAKRQLENATAEHQNMKGHFQKYPAIEERTTSDKTKAAEKVAKLGKQLKPSEDSQLKLAAPMCEAIWNLFSMAEASKQLPEPQPNAVSKEDYEALQDRFQRQQDLLDQQTSMIEGLVKTVKEASESATQAKNQASTVDRSISASIDTLKIRISKVESHDQPEKRKLHDMATTVSKQTSDIEQLRSDISDNKSELAAKANTLDTISHTVNSATSSTKALSDGLGKVERQIPNIKDELNQIWKEVNQIWKEVSETGKGSVISRLKSYDKTITNLWTKVEANENSVETRVKPVEERLEGLGQDLMKVRENLAEERLGSLGLAQELSKVKEDTRLHASSNAVASVPAPAATSAPTSAPESFDLASFKEEVVQEAGEQTEVLSEEMDKHSEAIETLKGGLDSLAKKLGDLELDHANGTRQRQSLDQANNDRHASISATCDLIKESVTAVEGRADTLQSDLRSLSTTVESLQNRPPVASPPVNGPVVSQFRSLPQPSAQAPSPRTSAMVGFPQTNGIHPPNPTAAPQQMVNGTPAGPSNNDMAVTVTSDQMQGLWATMHGLRQRMDNLTTDEVVKSMVDQASKMYPAPKDFQAAVTALQNADKTLGTGLASHDMRLTSNDQQLTTLRHSFKGYQDAQLQEQAQLNTQIQQLRGDVATTKNVTDQLPKESNDQISKAQKMFDDAVEAQTNTIVDIRKEVTNIRNQVNALADVAFGKEPE